MSPCEVLSCPHKDSRPCHHCAQPRRSLAPPGERSWSADGPGWVPGCWAGLPSSVGPRQGLRVTRQFGDGQCTLNTV